MDTSTITSKYQTVIPASIRRELGIKKNQELIWQIVQRGEHSVIAVTPKPKNWARYLSGLGKDVWKDVDTEKYLSSLRKEWRG